ncbi:hypothetical protein A9Q84_03380 [Halobacteriovorax marinus]|uniref:Uncharacterized protein n=1 Tax=Halobacteriovorax marinus TaxID=97084 RepID=A0A1Y5FGM9_9BACT|nr:hypothetical protein A9Q84_03380 [Halobacteriovorax marinus]
MRNATFLVLLLLSNIVSAVEIIRIEKPEREILNIKFDRTILPLIERFGSGDIVGNGGGLLEQNFMLAYHSLQASIENCLTNVDCFTSRDQKMVLKEINQLIIKKIDQTNPIIFLKNKDANGFFLDEFDMTERMAKTGYSEKHPIFINLDIAKEIKNDIPSMLGILIHELGHQIGIANHSFLDSLGAKVRRIWSSNWTVSDIKIGPLKLSTRLFSNKSNFINAKLSYEFDGQIKSINSQIFDSISCPTGEQLYGFYLTNGHWQRLQESGRRTMAKMTFWLDVYCQNLYGDLYPIQRDLNVLFKFHTKRSKDPVLRSVTVEVE